MNNEQANKLLLLSEDQLFTWIGNDLRPKGASPAPFKQLIMLGKDWLDKQQEKWHETICNDAHVRLLVNADNSAKDDVLLMIAISDLLYQYDIGVSPLPVALLLIRRGLSSYCSTVWR